MAAEKKEMTGLAIGVSSMKSGERALLHVGWELGYGKEGSFSFPNVPPMADLLYEVELIGFDETNEVSYTVVVFQVFLHVDIQKSFKLAFPSNYNGMNFLMRHFFREKLVVT